MRLTIEVQDNAGNALGSGPILSATEWNCTPKLDGAGTFSFSMPAGDPKSVLLVNKRIVICSSVIDSVVTVIGGGIIDKIEKSPGRPTMLRVSGPDLLSELGNIVVGNLTIREQVWTYLNDNTKGYLGKIQRGADIPPPTPYWVAHYTVASDANLATSEFIEIHSRTVAFIEQAEYLYVGYDAIFDGIRFFFNVISSQATEGDTLYLQYYSSTINGWEQVAFVDGTFVAGTWEQDGDVMFTPPADWVRYDEAISGMVNWNWYWIRIKLNQNGPDDPRYLNATIKEVMVHADFPTLDGVDQIMAFAPLWTTDPSPCPTVWPKYLRFQGESVLTALLMLAEQGGQEAGQAIREHFRLGAGREVEWLGTTITPSGLRAIRSHTTDTAAPETVLIADLNQTLDTSDVINRIFAFSGDGITLASSDRVAPAGYSYHVDAMVPSRGSYVEHDASVVAYGPIELWNIYSEIDQQVVNTITTHLVYTANAVFDAAIEDLRLHAELAKHYSLSVMRFAGLIKVGETIEVVYHEYADGIHTVNIDTYADNHPLWITGSGIKIDSKGLGTISLEVSTIDRDNVSDADIVVELVREKRRSGSGTTVIGGTGTAATPPVAGADTRVTGYRVDRAGNGALLFSGSGLVLAEYAATEAGIVAAFAASAVGDGVETPLGTLALTATLAVPAGRILRGRGWGSIITGYITLGVGAFADNFKNYQSVNVATDVVGISGPGAAGDCYVRDVFVEIVNAGAGKGLGLLATGTGNMHVYGETKCLVNGGTGSRWAYAEEDGSKLYYHHGNVKAWIGA